MKAQVGQTTFLIYIPNIANDQMKPTNDSKAIIEKLNKSEIGIKITGPIIKLGDPHLFPHELILISTFLSSHLMVRDVYLGEEFDFSL